MPSPVAASSYPYAGCSYPYPYPVSSSSTETPKRGKTRAPRTRMNKPRMMAFWMEVALKVKVVAPVSPTLMNPNLASPSSSTNSAWAVAKKSQTDNGQNHPLHGYERNVGFLGCLELLSSSC